MHSSLWLTALLVVPLLGMALLIPFRKVTKGAYIVGVATAAVELAISLVVLFLYNSGIKGAGTFDFAYRLIVAAPFGLAYDVAVSGISIVMIVLTAIVVVVALLGARETKHEVAFVCWMLFLLMATMGAFVSHDLLEFFLFFELTLVPSYFLIAQWGGPERARAALKFFIYTFFGSGFLLVGILYLGFAHLHQAGGDLNFSYGILSGTSLSHGTEVWLFIAFAISFAIKSPIFPFHTWSPIAYAEAPTSGSMVLSALLAKLGTYGLLVFAVGLFPLALHTIQPYVLTLAVIGILYGSALAAVSKDMKRLVAYSSLAQVGFITLGTVTGSKLAMVGAVLLMFNHGVITAAFFLIIGYIEKRRGSYLLADLKGLQGPAPVLAALFTVVMLASIGLPGLSGFISEFLILLGTFGTHQWWGIVATTGVLFSALYLLWAYQQVFQGKAEGPNATIKDVSGRERLIILPLIMLIVGLGVFPQPLLNRITPSVQQIVVHVAPTGVSK
jgi:NADH-quinone oxidoreductase subunit M